MIRPRAHLEGIFRTKDETESRAPYLRLDKNERLITLSDPVYQHFQRLLTPDLVMAYPELEPLYQRLAEYLKVDRNHLFLSAGSDLGIKSVYETYVGPGDSVVIHAPCYAMQEVYSKIFQAKVTRVPCTKDLELDVQAFLKAITPGTRLVAIESPNGFTGLPVSTEAMEAIVQKAQQCQAIVLIDEAYYLFGGKTHQPLYAKYDNVIISRTFSKDLGLAGLRCAYLLSQAANIESIYHVKPMHEINSIAAAFVMASLAYPEQITQYAQQVRAGKEALAGAMQKAGLVCRNGDANFIPVCLGPRLQMEEFLEKLKEHKTLIRRPPTLDLLKDWVRITIGSPAQMQRFTETFFECLKQMEAKVQ